MDHVSCADFRREIAHYLDRVKYRGERFVIHRRGREAALLVPLAEPVENEPAREVTPPAARRSPPRRPAEDAVDLEGLRRELGLRA
jgi:prevent-host-death family protein